MEKQLQLLTSLLPKPFSHGEQEQEFITEPEEIDLFETVEYDPDEEIEEILNGAS